MKVSGKKPPGSSGVVRLQKTGTSGPARPAEKPDVADKVDLSGKAREIRELAGIVNSLPEVRTEKVEGIKAKVDSGEYVVDTDKVAEKIIDEIV
ncbi:MAG: flagellar biosynthesis anti-sigma factor FlgM [Deltaproteobacteria bacterium]|nr:flagellar biosynthesis anti-sigma factor FlgM [Deltaproteobacteria bacterium]